MNVFPILAYMLVGFISQSPVEHLDSESVRDFGRLKLNESLCYTVNGVFNEYREAGIGTVEAHVDSASYQQLENLLTLRGQIVKRDAEGAVQSPAESGILIGTFENFPLERGNTSVFQFDIRHFWSMDSTGRFCITTKVFPTDYICFVTQTSDSLVELYYADIYDLSSLVSPLTNN